jgi:hypothetical protein
MWTGENDVSEHATLSGPTPKPVFDAIAIIQKYLQAGNWEQAIINQGGGVSFRLTSIHEDWMKSLGMSQEQLELFTGGRRERRER